MINELLRIEHHMKLAGIELNDDWHPSMRTNAKSVKIFLFVTISKNGKIHSITRDDKKYLGLRHYYVKKSNSGLTFKVLPKTPIVMLQKGIQHTIDLADKLAGSKSKKIDALQSLADSLQKTDATECWITLTKANPELKKEKCFISLEVENEFDFYAPVQSLTLQREINRLLFKLNSKEKIGLEVDALGKPNPKYDPFSHKVTTEIPVYSRNKDNKCYSRYGLNGVELFPLSAASRNRLAKIADCVFNDTYTESPVFSTNFFFRRSKSDSNPVNLIVLSTLVPKLFVEEQKITLYEWKSISKQNLEILTKQSPKIGGLPGGIVVYRKPAQGPWNIECNREFTCDELIAAMTTWDKGIQNIITERSPMNLNSWTPTIFSITNLLSARYIREGTGYKRDKKHVSTWTLRDSVELFAGSKAAYIKATKILALFLAPVFTRCVAFNDFNKQFDTPESLNYFIPTVGLIFYKENFMSNDTHQSPMFCLGAMLHEANRIHRRFFTCRGQRPPAELIGFRYLKMAFTNPIRAHACFQSQFTKYYLWATDRHNQQRQNKQELDRDFSLKTYEEMARNSCDLPAQPTYSDTLKMASGFYYRKKFTEKSSEQPVVSEN